MIRRIGGAAAVSFGPAFECPGCGATWNGRRLENEFHYPQCPISRSPQLLAIIRKATR